MKVVCISDTHGQHRDLSLPEGDLLLHAGDLSRKGTEPEVRDFLDWFSSLDYQYKVFIGGNHDFYLENHPRQFAELVPESCIYLDDSGVEIEGMKIWGSPVTPFFFDWAFNRHRGQEIMFHWDRIPTDTDILLTHGPPHGIQDLTAKHQAVGCMDLKWKIKEIKPRLHVFGHIHEAYGQIEADGTHYVNASILDLRYHIRHEPVVVEL